MLGTADRRTVVGVFKDAASAEVAVAVLRQVRFGADDVAVEESGPEAPGSSATAPAVTAERPLLHPADTLNAERQAAASPASSGAPGSAR
jgi:hypothetical protein